MNTLVLKNVDFDLTIDFKHLAKLEDMTIHKISCQNSLENSNLEQLETLKTLKISNQLELKSLPNSIGSLHNLTTFRISDCPLPSLPDSIGSLRNLTTFRLSHCPLPSLPDSIGSLHNLTTFRISHCPLPSLPDSIGSLHNLTTLELSTCSLSSLPNSIGSLQNLTSLDVGHNPNLTDLPKSFENLLNLKKFSIYETQIDKKHPYLQNLPQYFKMEESELQSKKLSEIIATYEEMRSNCNKYNRKLIENFIEKNFPRFYSKATLVELLKMDVFASNFYFPKRTEYYDFDYFKPKMQDATSDEISSIFFSGQYYDDAKIQQFFQETYKDYYDHNLEYLAKIIFPKLHREKKPLKNFSDWLNSLYYLGRGGDAISFFSNFKKYLGTSGEETRIIYDQFIASST